MDKMGIIADHPHTLEGGVTPACNECGIVLCYDIPFEEYLEEQDFWDSWICEDCNGGIPMYRKEFYQENQK
jgi:hypothetical protein